MWILQVPRNFVFPVLNGGMFFCVGTTCGNAENGLLFSRNRLYGSVHFLSGEEMKSECLFSRNRLCGPDKFWVQRNEE